jgi:hypothetical protein
MLTLRLQPYQACLRSPAEVAPCCCQQPLSHCFLSWQGRFESHARLKRSASEASCMRWRWRICWRSFVTSPAITACRGCSILIVEEEEGLSFRECRCEDSTLFCRDLWLPLLGPVDLIWQPHPAWVDIWRLCYWRFCEELLTWGCDRAHECREQWTGLSRLACSKICGSIWSNLWKSRSVVLGLSDVIVAKPSNFAGLGVLPSRGHTLLLRLFVITFETKIMSFREITMIGTSSFESRIDCQKLLYYHIMSI